MPDWMKLAAETASTTCYSCTDDLIGMPHPHFFPSDKHGFFFVEVGIGFGMMVLGLCGSDGEVLLVLHAGGDAHGTALDHHDIKLLMKYK